MPQVPRLVWLDQADAQDAALVGAKASRLAAARARGLPVLNGLVVPVEVGGPVVRAGEAALRSTDNSGAARSAVFNHPPPSLLQDLAEEAQQLGDSLVVRSSSLAESEGIWAGAFSSYVGVKPEELTQGVMGCWASVFSPGTLKRGQVTETSPRQVGMAVLIQPEIRPSCGGVATVADDGTVTVVSARGHPAGLMAGWERGHVAIVNARGEVQADSSPPGTRLLRVIADLTTATAEKIRCNHIEWLESQEGRVHLVQAQPNGDARVEQISRPAPDPAQRTQPWMGGAVRMMIRYPGPVGEQLVWPWAIGLEDLSPAPSEPDRKTVATLVENLRQGAALLMSERWGGPETLADFVGAWSAFRNGDSSSLVDLIGGHRSVDRLLGAAHLRNLQDLGQALTAAGVIPHPGWVWHLDPNRLDQPSPSRQSPMRRIGATPWDAWIYGVVTSQGESITGIPAAGGWGVGRLRSIRNPDDATRFSPREVIAVSHPIGNIAPLLWNASGLVTSEGSPGAHLFEVAKWLGVPAVCGVDFSRLAGETQIRSGWQDYLTVAVDGGRGHITFTRSKT
ncbi:MAG: PEP-utilizing enzyme [bacterium]|nr:hypothetical protein [Acidimicrobiia bacterium]MCY4648968.1 PEP-utilizing enzyme [bacterium]